MSNTNTQPDEQVTMYDLIGGEEGLRQLVEQFYTIMDQDQQATTIRAMHKEDLTFIKQGLFEFLSGWLGGPPLYVIKNGSPCITKQHRPFKIDQQASDEWMHCMKQALENVDIEAQYREMLIPAFQRVCDSLINAHD